MSRVGMWSKALLVGSTFVVAYALLVLAVMHAHAMHEAHGPSHAHDEVRKHAACPLAHLALLALATGLTGMLAACSAKSRYLWVFAVLLLICEIGFLGHIGRRAARQAQVCTEVARRVTATTTITGVHVAPGVDLFATKTELSAPYVDGAVREECLRHLRHSVLMASIIVGVICSSLACCGSSLAAALRREEEAAAAAADDEDAIEGVPLKADPLADDVTPPAVVFVTRV